MARPPSLNALRVFVAVSRHGGFTRAALALGVTQSAVSRQVAVLEQSLGTQLFVRESSGATLTAVGMALFGETGPALDRIAAATEAVRKPERDRGLRLRVYATFAVKWLLPRLPKFEKQYPNISLELSTVVAPVDFKRDPVDLAIQFGQGTWPGMETRLLMPDVTQPVCSPRLLQNGRIPQLAGMLSRHRMLHSRYRRHDWRDWLNEVGRPDLLQPGLEFPSSVLTLQAAVEGLGIAIGQTALLAADFEDRRLVPLFGTALHREMGHFLVWPAKQPLGRKGRALVAWIIEEATARPQPCSA